MTPEHKELLRYMAQRAAKLHAFHSEHWVYVNERHTSSEAKAEVELMIQNLPRYFRQERGR